MRHTMEYIQFNDVYTDLAVIIKKIRQYNIKINNMKLYELLSRILESTPDQWNSIACWGHGSGPSYKDKLEFYEVFNGQENVLHVDSHSDICVFKEDIDITMAYGITSNEDFIADWANQFPNPSAYSNIIDIFYRGSLVHRETYLVVDGGRCELPIPSYGENGELVVGKDYYNFIKLLEKISTGSTNDDNFNYYFNRTGIKIIEDKWI